MSYATVLSLLRRIGEVERDVSYIAAVIEQGASSFLNGDGEGTVSPLRRAQTERITLQLALVAAASETALSIATRRRGCLASLSGEPMEAEQTQKALKILKLAEVATKLPAVSDHWTAQRHRLDCIATAHLEDAGSDHNAPDIRTVHRRYEAIEGELCFLTAACVTHHLRDRSRLAWTFSERAMGLLHWMWTPYLNRFRRQQVVHDGAATTSTTTVHGTTRSAAVEAVMTIGPSWWMALASIVDGDETRRRSRRSRRRHRDHEAREDASRRDAGVLRMIQLMTSHAVLCLRLDYHGEALDVSLRAVEIAEEFQYVVTIRGHARPHKQDATADPEADFGVDGCGAATGAVVPDRPDVVLLLAQFNAARIMAHLRDVVHRVSTALPLDLIQRCSVGEQRRLLKRCHAAAEVHLGRSHPLTSTVAAELSATITDHRRTQTQTQNRLSRSTPFQTMRMDQWIRGGGSDDGNTTLGMFQGIAGLLSQRHGQQQTQRGKSALLPRASGPPAAASSLLTHTTHDNASTLSSSSSSSGTWVPL